jgi:hypothetical protein
MVDEYVEVSNAPGCLDRLKDSIAKVGIGIVMILVAFPLLFWNEGRAVKRAQDLEFGRGAVVQVDAGKVDSSKNGQLVHLNGKLVAKKPAVDDQFGVKADAIAIRRGVEMYQWTEEKDTKKKGDKNVTTYRYVEAWKSSQVNSSNFNKSGYDNPSMPAESETFYSPQVMLGAYKLDTSLAEKWSIDGSYTVKKEQLSGFGKLNGRTPVLDGSYVYFGDPASPTIGDVRISYEIGTAGDASAIAGLQKGVLSAYSNPEMNGTIAMLESGTQSPDAMFQSAEDSNVIMTWVLRFVGFFLMFMGFNLLFGPIDTIVRMIPIVGGVIDFGTTVLAGILAAPLSLITIAIGWIFYRPLIGILLLVGALAIIGLGAFLAMKATKKSEA